VPYEQLYLNDFEGAGEGPNVGLAFKRAKYEMLIAEYGTEGPDGIDYAVDNDPEVIAMARELGIEAKTPTELMAEESDDVAEDATESEDAPARAQFKEIEMRSAGMGEFNITEGEDGQRTFSGYAALFDSPSIGLPFTETIKPGAFKRSLSRANAGQKIIAFLFGHEETRALATTASGRLKLEEDSKGLRVEAKLDPSDPDAAKVISMLTHEAAAAGMSFGFTVPKGGDSWVGEDRQLKEVNLIEASILSPGQQAAYPATTGLAAVRKITAPRLGIEAERLISTLESVKAGKSLSEDEVLVLDTVRARLAPARASMDPSIASAKLKLAELENETL
jgi:HK97 family phage prohead protease